MRAYSRVSNLRIRNCFLLFFVFAFTICFLYKQTLSVVGDDFHSKLDIHDHLQDEAIQATFHCLSRYFEKGVEASHRGKFDQAYAEIHTHINQCARSVKNSLPISSIRNDDEQKYFLPPLNRHEDCHIVTLGVGRDVTAEMSIKKDYPRCNFLGADPDDEVSGKMYREDLGGRFVKTAIARSDGVYNASIINANNVQYHDQVMFHMSFEKFINDYNGNRPIDLLFIDIEGAEFHLWEYIVDNIERLPVICQVNVEFHFPHRYPPMGNNILEVFHRMTTRERFLMLQIEAVGPFYRIYLLNVRDNRCLRNFLGKSLPVDSVK